MQYGEVMILQGRLPWGIKEAPKLLFSCDYFSPGGPIVSVTLSPASLIMLTMSLWCMSMMSPLLTAIRRSPTFTLPHLSVGLPSMIRPVWRETRATREVSRNSTVSTRSTSARSPSSGGSHASTPQEILDIVFSDAAYFPLAVVIHYITLSLLTDTSLIQQSAWAVADRPGRKGLGGTVSKGFIMQHQLWRVTCIHPGVVSRKFGSEEN